MPQEASERIKVEVHLYGSLARYGGDRATKSYARLKVELTARSKMKDLLNFLGISPSKRGLTFINHVLANLPGLSADLDMELNDLDRIGLFSVKSVWPVQYRLGARTTPELEASLRQLGSSALRTQYRDI